MKFLIVFVALFAVALAAPEKDDTVVKYEVDVEPEGYNFNYEISDGTVRQENGHFQGGADEGSYVVDGSVSWVSPEGEKISLNYVADENGYRAEGDHIPKF